ncbi:hypothetical protein Dimus_035226 [Dionaea muscipula]
MAMAMAAAAVPVEPKSFNELCCSMISCPSCGHRISLQDHQDFLGSLPAGVKFDPTDIEILEHLEAKVRGDSRNLHPLLDKFIPTIEGENGICYAHPQKLPGVSKDGVISHFFHRPSKAYTTGTRKRRKVLETSNGEGGGDGETRWHKTGKTRAVMVNGSFVKGFKKILVLYTNYGRQKKPEKTNWVMHQYHLGDNEEEKDGELVASKVFYQTQPRQCAASTTTVSELPPPPPPPPPPLHDHGRLSTVNTSSSFIQYYHSPPLILHHDINAADHERNKEELLGPSQLIPNLVGHSHHGSSFIGLLEKKEKNDLTEDKDF